MEPTEELREEHDAIIRMADVLERICSRIEAGEKVSQGHLDGIVLFAREFVDGCHHRKEEEALFPAMENSEIYREGGISDHLRDHETGRKYVTGMGKALIANKKGDGMALRRFAENARNYASLLRRHIDSENNILFPAAEEYVPDAKKKEMAESFEKIEREKGGHEKFLKAIGSLEKAYPKQG